MRNHVKRRYTRFITVWQHILHTGINTQAVTVEPRLDMHALPRVIKVQATHFPCQHTAVLPMSTHKLEAAAGIGTPAQPRTVRPTLLPKRQDGSMPVPTLSVQFVQHKALQYRHA